MNFVAVDILWNKYIRSAFQRIAFVGEEDRPWDGLDGSQRRSLRHVRRSYLRDCSGTYAAQIIWWELDGNFVL